MLLVPSLVNPPAILDLSPEKSLARYLAARGHDPWLVDWGTPQPDEAGMDLAGHVEKLLLPLIAAMPAPPILLGYCLGGTLALAAALHCAPPALALLAAPWHFDGYPDAERDRLGALWHGAREPCEKMGYVPMEVLQSGFWSLDPERTIRKYAAFADMDIRSPAAQAFIAVEDWANGGPPLTYQGARGLFEDLYAGNMTGAGAWKIAGRLADPAALSCPVLSMRSTTDRIVPLAAALALGDVRDTALGHVGMIVSERAPEQIWRPLSDWLGRHGVKC